MNWSKLFEMQKALDEYIEEKNNLSTMDLFDQKYLALLVELGELANETRCFKFWSTQHKSSTEEILEEYVDGLHFILSLGIEMGYYFFPKNTVSTSLHETEQFNKVFEACVNFKKDKSEESYNHLFINFLQLGQILGFNEKEIQLAYYHKNKINYQRQNEGY